MITLEPIDPLNSDFYRDSRNDYSIRKWCRQIGLISQSDQEHWMQKQAMDPTIQMYEVCYDGTPVGMTGLTSIDLVHRRAEFSLWIAKEYQKCGHGKKALELIIAFGFNELGLNSIWGESFDGNPAMKMFESLGFVKEGVRRQFYFKEGKFIDAHLFSLLRSDWKS